jgi:hypothetical protein
LRFDKLNNRVIFVDVSDWRRIERACERLDAAARAIKLTGYKVSNPITQANASFKMQESADPSDQIIAEVRERLPRLEARTPRRSDPPVAANHPVFVVYQDGSSHPRVLACPGSQSLGQLAGTGLQANIDELYLYSPNRTQGFFLSEARADISLSQFAGSGARI